MVIRFLFVSCTLLILSACQDPSPLRSETEVKFNSLFKTEFGVLDQLIIKKRLENGNYDTVSVINPQEMIAELSNSQKASYKDEYNADYKLLFKTSTEMQKYSKEQTEAIVNYNSTQHILCYKSKCYRASEKMRNFLKENGLE
ncbi:hypothetical protein [Ectobacillus antri]|uniref:hypothetical protein n=1 Tax=Ectobacillus antri TaxID=2486280 RepID=UPI000F5B39E3|nr:hypothetical protein [Ectobacillus antri]